MCDEPVIFDVVCDNCRTTIYMAQGDNEIRMELTPSKKAWAAHIIQRLAEWMAKHE